MGIIFIKMGVILATSKTLYESAWQTVETLSSNLNKVGIQRLFVK